MAARLRLTERRADPVRVEVPGSCIPKSSQVTPPSSSELAGEIVSGGVVAGGRGAGGGVGSEVGPGGCWRMWVTEFLSARYWQTSAITAGGAGVAEWRR